MQIKSIKLASLLAGVFIYILSALAGLFVGYIAASSNCCLPAYNSTTKPLGSGTATEKGVTSLPVIMPLDYLSGKEWDVGIFDSSQVQSVLLKELNLQEGEYGVLEICKEIERAIGMPILWIPNVPLEGISAMKVFKVSADNKEKGRFENLENKIRVCDALKHVLSYLSEVGIAGYRPLGKYYSFTWIAVPNAKSIVIFSFPYENGVKEYEEKIKEVIKK